MRGLELLEEAKKRYPIGTTFKSPHTKGTYIVREENYGDKGYYLSDSNVSVLCHQDVTNGGEYLCLDGQWGKIISLPFKNYELW